jgi:hypothetical protein
MIDEVPYAARHSILKAPLDIPRHPIHSAVE